MIVKWPRSDSYRFGDFSRSLICTALQLKYIVSEKNRYVELSLASILTLPRHEQMTFV